MKAPLSRRTLLAAAACAVAADAGAVMLGADGTGQALIFPYYTVQSQGSNPFNTYVSVVNHTTQAKALRVRVREARNAREVASFNLYMGPGDAWTGAVIPPLNSFAMARLISADESCTLPRRTATVEEPPGFSFQNSQYSGAFNDNNGSGLDRTREGWVEVIEMATLTGAMAAGVTHMSSGIPSNCNAADSPSASDIGPPTGGLSGTLTLINVASGEDFTVNAEALADLSTRSFFRPPSDPYPDLNALEIDPVSVVVANGAIYRSTWNRAADAVSAVLMRSSFMGEFILDAGTHSRSEMVITYPTRQFYQAGTNQTIPFSACTSFNTFGGQAATIRWFSREAASGTHESFGGIPPPAVANFRCSATTVLEFRNSSTHTQPANLTGVLGSDNRAVAEGAAFVAAENGWFEVTPTSNTRFTSLPGSTRIDLLTGAVTTGAHAFGGVPAVGFAVRTFVNGTLACSGGACQGNYGGSFPLKFRRTITP
jgi:hypothetical protein